MGSWDGDWRARIAEFALRAGHDHIWVYLRAHPELSLAQIAKMVGNVAPVDIQRLAQEHCLTHGLFAEFVCDWMARDIREEVQPGWSNVEDLRGVCQLFWIGGDILRDPQRALASALGTALLDQALPPGWWPESGSDSFILRAYEGALASLTVEQQQMIERGESLPDPGDAYWSKLAPIWEKVSIYDGAAVFRKQFGGVRAELGHLFAAHWCQVEVCNGGFDQFFGNSTGVLGPEAVAGFRAIGMPRCAELVATAIRKLREPYPRSRRTRQARLDSLRGRPFHKLDAAFFAAIDEEAGGFRVAADRYSETIDGST